MSRWCILRTDGSKTLPLMRSLSAAGFVVWTPARTIRKVTRPGTRHEQRSELDVPILPTFVFARERDLPMLADVTQLSISPHPGFSIFRYGGRIPLVGDAEVAGLREEEARAAAIMQAMRDAESREEAERIRIDAIKSETARRRALMELEQARRAEQRAKPLIIGVDDEVAVEKMPALVGIPGIVKSIVGPHAFVQFGNRTWKIEGWRLSPYLDEQQAA
ncbi:hypothetical protein [Sphingomonas sp. Leaf343]|uniref:hypothetical protein n=1 Tax=Sphingomonas sp. Leaf343 TaxID=1736345 RepID=UPI0006FF2663|nr:hypothetical protein [Sphingomonas sp. Leaf343]KQR83464.1 hypothetical protein ASG07_06975 [Sphingomonas sp. Leaf343]